MIVCPGLPNQVQWLEVMDPAEELVELCGHQELPDVPPTERRPQLVGLLRQLEHLVPGRGHPPAPCQAGVGADEAKAAGEETV